MASPQETAKADLVSPDISEQFKQILQANGIREPVAQVIVGDSGLTGEGFASSQKLVTIKFENPKTKPLNLFMKAMVDSDSHNQFVGEIKAFEKEARFFMNYLPATREFCKSMGYGETLEQEKELHISVADFLFFADYFTGKNV